MANGDEVESMEQDTASAQMSQTILRTREGGRRHESNFGNGGASVLLAECDP
jgi:hypothetical protein